MSSFVRVAGRTLRTSITRWTHPDTGRAVTFVATVHFAERAYYEELRFQIVCREAAGAVVWSEGMGARLAEAMAKPLSDLESQILDEQAVGARLNAERAADLGWISQHEGLAPASSWRGLDMCPLEAIRAVGSATMLARVRKANRILAAQDRSVVMANLGMVMVTETFRRTSRQADEQILAAQRNDPFDLVVVGERNRMLLEGVVDGQAGDAVLVWGALHGPGVAAGLGQRGYLLADQTWHEVGQLPSRCMAVVRALARRQPPARRQRMADVTDVGRQITTTAPAADIPARDRPRSG